MATSASSRKLIAPFDQRRDLEVAREHAALTSETASADSRAKRSGKPGPRMSPAERDLLLKLLVAGERKGAINAVFLSLGYAPPASSALAYYRERWRASIEQARASRTERALT
jgi:hypothetical protein